MTTQYTLSRRAQALTSSAIREILKVTERPEVISFAGGLPSPATFPVERMREATEKVLRDAPQAALQYGPTEGFTPLREWIAARLSHGGAVVPASRVLITTGSQQGLDLLGKTFLNEGDDLVIEEPGYLGAIQAFAMYRPRFHPVPVAEGGMDIATLTRVLGERRPKLLYTVTNFQNPCGISYSDDNRRAVAELVRGTGCLIIQDDPYGDLRFTGSRRLSFKRLLPAQTVLLGSFSKTVAPSLRLGWLVAPPPIMDKLVIAKQAADLHTNGLAQRILHRFLIDNDLDAHIATIIRAYGRQKEAMISAIRDHFPAGVQCTDPEGGMFLWVTLPEGMSSMALFDAAIRKKVAFVPGTPFYVDRKDSNTLRLNFSCSDEPTIVEGIRRLGTSIKELS